MTGVQTCALPISDQETVKQNGAIDRTFEPELSKEERDEKMSGWHKAVRYAEGWAK